MLGAPSRGDWLLAEGRLGVVDRPHRPVGRNVAQQVGVVGFPVRDLAEPCGSGLTGLPFEFACAQFDEAFVLSGQVKGRGMRV